MPGNKSVSIVNGPELWFARFGVALTIMMVLLRITRNPFTTLNMLRSLIRERMAIHDNSGNKKAVRSGYKYFWSINMPGWPSASFNHFIRNEFKRINSPGKGNLQTVIFAITNLCPLNCIHCYEWDNISDKNSLSFNDLKRAMEKIERSGIRHVQFSGGEPMSRFDEMIELMRLSGRSTDFWINTSGFGLTYDKALTMKRNGMTGAVISLDDWDEHRHNQFRGNKRSFYWVQEAVKNCRRAGIIVCLSICPVREFVSEENLDKYHRLAKKMGAGFVRILEPVRTGRLKNADARLSEKHVDLIRQFMISRNNDPKYAGFPVIQFPGHHQRKSGCLGAGNRYIYIDPNGDYHNCPFCRRPLGNIRTQQIDEGIAAARRSGCHHFTQKEVTPVPYEEN
jgi:MoaA/NifB/PqqE/SkfB family radical SAM enzyme